MIGRFSIKLVIVVTCGYAALAQQGGTAAERYNEALDLMTIRGDVEESLEKFAQVANEFQGSPWAALALQRLAQWTPDVQQQRAFLQRVITEYPDSEYAFISAVDLLGMDYHQDIEGWFREMNRFATDLGGPPFESILETADRSALSAQVLALPYEAQWRLYTIYSLAWSRTSGEYYGRKQPERGLPMALFLRETFEGTGVAGISLSGNIYSNLERISSTPVSGYYSSLVVDPTVDIQSPSQNSTTGPLPNDVAPLLGNGAENRVAELMELFEAELARLSSVPLAERRQWAWMSPNVQLAARAGTDKNDYRWTALHASAVDRDYYYYIPQYKNRQVKVNVDPADLSKGFVTYETSRFVSFR